MLSRSLLGFRDLLRERDYFSCVWCLLAARTARAHMKLCDCRIELSNLLFSNHGIGHPGVVAAEVMQMSLASSTPVISR